MAYIRAHETSRVRNGKAAKRYEVVWTEQVRDGNGLPVPADPAKPTGRKKTRDRQESYGTKAEAETRRDELNAARHHASAQTPSEQRRLGDMPLAVFAATFFEGLVGGVKPRTEREARAVYRRYIEETFGNQAVATITAADVRKFRAALLSPRPRRSYNTKSPSAETNTESVEMVTLARTTIKPAWELLQRILDVAVVDGAIRANPMHSVKLPRPSSSTATRPDEEEFAPNPLTAEQVAAVSRHIAEELRRPIYALAVTFAAYTGLRAGELQGLNVGNLTLPPSGGQNGSVRVTRTRRPVRGGWETGTPKSKRSKRSVPIDGWLADDLRAYLHQVHPHGNSEAATHKPDAPLFPGRYTRADAVAIGIDPRDDTAMNRWDAPLNCSNVYKRYFQRAVAAVGLEHSRWHDLRHTFAVMSLSAGEHYMQVSKWLGHASFVTTLTVYADYIAENEGGKQAPLTRPLAEPAQQQPAVPQASNVVQLFGRRSG